MEKLHTKPMSIHKNTNATIETIQPNRQPRFFKMHNEKVNGDAVKVVYAGFADALIQNNITNYLPATDRYFNRIAQHGVIINEVKVSVKDINLIVGIGIATINADGTRNLSYIDVSKYKDEYAFKNNILTIPVRALIGGANGGTLFIEFGKDASGDAYTVDAVCSIEKVFGFVNQI